jgi:chromosomal replication initiation ATPase DnaA
MGKQKITLPALLSHLAQHQGVPEYVVLSDTRKQEAVTVRQLFAYFSWAYTNYSLVNIGHHINRRYSTVICSRNRISELYEVDKEAHLIVESARRAVLSVFKPGKRIPQFDR